MSQVVKKNSPAAPVLKQPLVTEIEGNLLDFPDGINVVAHSANCLNIMGGGFAAQVKARYPQAYAADVRAYERLKENPSRLGQFSAAVVSDDGKRVVNLYTQLGIGGARAVNYEGFYEALDTLVKILSNANKSLVNPEETKYKLGLPHGISCGLAGGNWNVIRAMIEDIATIRDFPITLVKYTPKS